jgi:hypothetical protein
MPSTIANASSSSGSRRFSRAASTRAARASRSNSRRSGGRHARCHSTAASSMPPAKNPSATDTASHNGRRSAHANIAPATLVERRT